MFRLRDVPFIYTQHSAEGFPILVWYIGQSGLLEVALIYDHCIICLEECGIRLCKTMLRLMTYI